jgi:hypothetical protein
MVSYITWKSSRKVLELPQLLAHIDSPISLPVLIQYHGQHRLSPTGILDRLGREERILRCIVVEFAIKRPTRVFGLEIRSRCTGGILKQEYETVDGTAR